MIVQIGLDHRTGHFRPPRIIAQVHEPIVLWIVRCFCVVQKQKGVAGAMIEAGEKLQQVVVVSLGQCTPPAPWAVWGPTRRCG